MKSFEDKYVHTSSESISIVRDDGTFGSFLFFTNETPYWITACKPNYVYGLDRGSVNLIEAGRLFYEDDATPDNQALWVVVREVADRFDVDEDMACSLIDESENLWDVYAECDAEDSWWLQQATARAARALGYDGVEVEDEQGVSYMIDCAGRELEELR